MVRSRRLTAVRLAATAAGLLATLIAATPAWAIDWVVSDQIADEGTANASQCSDGPNATRICDDRSVAAFAGRVGTGGAKTPFGGACYNATTQKFDVATGRSLQSHSVFGCTDDAGPVSVDAFRKVVLAPVTIRLTGFDCDATGCVAAPETSVTIFGTWTGFGPIDEAGTGVRRVDAGSCASFTFDLGRHRAASFVGSFDPTGSDIFGGRFATRTDC
jgi:hypothetical protein